jgi:serine protease Do
MSDELNKYNNGFNEDNKNNTYNHEYSFWKEEGASSYNHGVNETQNDFRNDTDNIIIRENNDEQNYNTLNHMNPNDDNNNKNKGSGKLVRVLGFVTKGIVFGVIAAVTFIGVNKLAYELDLGSYRSYGDSGLYLNESSNNEYRIEKTDILNSVVKDTDVTQVVEETMPSTVTITGTFTETYNFFGQEINKDNDGGGSGIIIGKNEKELLIATNNHVVEGANPIVVTFIDGTTGQGIIKGTDSTADLAVVSVDLSSISKETQDAIKIAKIHTDENVKVGEKVIAIGNALGYGQSVTVGYISARDREVTVPPNNNKMILLQTDAAINPGNSGGALLNLAGEVIGINTVKFASNEVEGMGYAIPISRAMPIINELMSREILAEEEQGYLGIGIKDVTEEIANMFGWPIGVYVSEISEGSGAGEAGLLTGDIITGLNDISITSTTQLVEKVTSYRIGTKVTVTVMRNEDGEYVEKEFQVTLRERPNL